MASEDVIELGSSDDEAEPATKKIKPTPNAMVHIPRKLHDVTIKPAKLNVASSLPKELAGKNVTVTKISKNANTILANPYAIKNKPNGKQFQMKQVLPKQIPQKIIPTFSPLVKRPIMIQNKPVTIQNKTSVNPLSVMKKITPQVVINKVPSTPKMFKPGIKIQSPRSINNLPPSITVTRTAGGQKRAAPVNLPNTVRKKQKRQNIPKTSVGEVLTVDLDDDDVSSSSTASPQWYLRPEEQSTSLEEENNKEPEPSKPSDDAVEITIEDSPVKPIKDKRTCEVSEALTVTIDDSPVKVTAEKNTASGSDGEAKVADKVPNSKKKLEYPVEAEVEEAEEEEDTVEIEISPMTEEPLKATNELEPSNMADTVIEIEESPLKVGGQGTSTPKKDHPKTSLVIPDSIKELDKFDDTDELSEFHPVYQSFIRLCFQLENSEDMKKIVEKKIKTYYRQVPKEYTESEDFTDMVAGKVLSMKAGPEKMYLYIKDIVDELNLQRKMAKSQVLTNIHEKKTGDAEKYLYGPDSEYDSKRQRQIRKLEKTLKKLHRAIQKLEEQEVDFDDDEDSVYLLTESDEGSTSNKDSDRQLEKDPKALLQRYKERMVRVHAKFCQLTNTKMPSEPRVQIDPRPGQASGPAKKLEKWINKKVPIGTPLPFPDFHDVLRCVREANEEGKLGWNEADIMEEARDLFTRCGKKLQRRRQENEWRIAASRISVEIDPAERNKDLMKKLDDNKKIAAKKEAEVFNKYADRQSQLKLEAEEIGDKEAEESPVDDDEEEDEPEPSDETSLENKEKRKERLKRLLQEKSKKPVLHTEEQKNDEVENKEDDGSQDKNTENEETHKDDKVVKLKIDTVCSENVNNIDNHDGNQKEDLKRDEVNENLVESEHKDDDVEMNTLSENKDASENESVKTIDSDAVEIVTNEKDTVSSITSSEIKTNKENPESTEVDDTTDKIDKAHSISDDSNKVESEIDELHLLQKLHSENEINTSTVESSDSETPIAISDTLGSSSDSKKQASSDVISIENSSYSESETNKDLSDSKDTNNKSSKVVQESVDDNIELECSNKGIEKKIVRTNNDEYNESIEDILLASTDDEVEIDKSKPADEDECVNLKDDSISIGDTVVEGVDKSQDTADSSPAKQDDVSSVDSVPCDSLKNDSPVESIMDTVNQDAENMNTVASNTEDENDNVEISSVDKAEDITSLKSENSIQSVQMIELKESSSEKEMEIIEESTLDSEDKENSSEEPMDTAEETANVACDKDPSFLPAILPATISDICEKSTNDSVHKENSPEEIMDSVDDSTKSNSSEDQVMKPSDVNTINNKL